MQILLQQSGKRQRFSHLEWPGQGAYVDNLQNRGSARTTPVWLETGEAVANTYSEMQEEALDRACLHNSYLEQARQAYLIGNKALSKESNVKGQLHNMQRKGTHACSNF
ncbi:polyadenylate-binding -interacting 7 [Olea europaea subsp. europaea]|uniref:Polyadenylate-binding -interacting 7 n=1 Tax=Olea europaea subsp. europaea TaxID=158383 RepID=A0A8S0UK98_OLEEU|nr:polyadenylate-binding -interacting 7 [Olea europaea subsp. europaea]